MDVTDLICVISDGLPASTASSEQQPLLSFGPRTLTFREEGEEEEVAEVKVK